MQCKRRALARVVTFVAALAALSGCGDSGPKKLSDEDLATAVKPSVVELSGKVGDDKVGGTGVVIDAVKGYVLTNAHVISGVSALSAKVGDDAATSGPARIVAQAPCDDLAIVQFVNKPEGMKAIKLGKSADVKSGEHVTAFGYPASFENPEQQTVVVTSGSVSSPHVAAEPDPSLPKYPSTIQHQAPINPGNSGGPLVNSYGELIGINTLTNTGQGDRPIQGQNYAISIDHAITVLTSLKAGKDIAYVGWDLTPIDQVSLRDVFGSDSTYNTANDGHDITSAAERYGASIQRVIETDESKQGLFVVGTETGSPAKKVGLIYGDLVTSIEGTHVKSVADVCDIIASHAPGSKVRVRGFYLNSTSDINKVLDPWRALVTLK